MSGGLELSNRAGNRVASTLVSDEIVVGALSALVGGVASGAVGHGGNASCEGRKTCNEISHQCQMMGVGNCNGRSTQKMHINTQQHSTKNNALEQMRRVASEMYWPAGQADS